MNWDKQSTLFRKTASDILFGAIILSSFLKLRRSALNKAYLTQKISPFVTAVLKFEKRRQINSSLFYVQRSILYLLLSVATSAISHLYDASNIGVLARGALWGCCFGLIGSGVAVGCAASVAYSYLEAQLQSYL